MTSSLHSISSIPEMEKAIETIFRVSPMRNPIPPVLITLPYSVELEFFMNALCDELEDAGCISFTGERRWLNFRLDYPENQDFSSFSLMLQCLHRFSGYRNSFGGVVRIDLTDWTDHTDDPKLSAVFAYVHDYSDSVFFILSVTTDEPACADALKKEANKWMHTVTADASCPSVETLARHISDKLGAFGCRLTDEADDLLRSSISALSSQKHFAGMRQIESLGDAILMEIGDIKEITVDHLAPFAPDSDWITACMDAEEITIGFTGGKQNARQ
jgi:hypothetical protein